MDLQLNDKTVLVTRAGQGLGLAIGLAFAREGVRVAFHCNSSAEGTEKAAAEVNAQAAPRERFLDTAAADWEAQVDVTVTGIVSLLGSAVTGLIRSTSSMRLPPSTVVRPVRRSRLMLTSVSKSRPGLLRQQDH